METVKKVWKAIKAFLNAVWTISSYLFWPQKTDKTRYDS